MERVAIAFALFTLTAGPVVAQGADMAGPSVKTTARKDQPKNDYWVSRDLSTVLTKVVTIKVR